MKKIRRNVPAARERETWGGGERVNGIIIFNIVVKMCIYTHRRQHRVSKAGVKKRQLTTDGRVRRGRRDIRKKRGSKGERGRQSVEPARIIPPEAFRIFIVATPT